MIDLNENVSELNLNPTIIKKLNALNMNKIGHLATSSYDELSYTQLFTNNELAEIQTCLTEQGIDSNDKMDLDALIDFKREKIRFIFSEYQKALYKYRSQNYDKNKILYLKFDNPLYIVEYFYLLSNEINIQSSYGSEIKMALNNFLINHPTMTIEDFLDVDINSNNQDIIKLISQILDLPLNCEITAADMVSRSNNILNYSYVFSNKIQEYVDIANLTDQDLNEYLMYKLKNKAKQYTKSN